MRLLSFLGQVVVISLSGVLAPGPITAAAIAMGARSGYSGALIAVGHGIIEFPLMILIVLGAGKILKSAKAKMIIGVAGGAFLVIMAVQMLTSLGAGGEPQGAAVNSAPLWVGLILSAGNPYFLVWWATVGLRLATDARQLGVLAFVLFMVVHWLCDLVWLGILSWGSFKGLTVLGGRSQEVVLVVCAVALFGFGLFFVYKASALMKMTLARNR